MITDAIPRIRASLLAATLALVLGGCEKAMQDMYNQPKYKPLAASVFWRDHRSARPDVPGAIAYSAGATAGTSSGRLARSPLPLTVGPTYPVDDQGHVKADLAPGSLPPLVATNPLPMTQQTLALRTGMSTRDVKARGAQVFRHHGSESQVIFD